MVQYDKFLAALKAFRARYAEQALLHPAGKDDFEYGYHCGIIAGATQAEVILNELLSEDDRDERKRAKPATPYAV